MITKLYRRISLFFLVIAFFGAQASLIPVSGENSQGTTDKVSSSLLVTVDDFARPLINGNSKQLVGAYAETSFAYPVVQQPTNNPAFVSLDKGKVTQFSQASRFGSIGLIAHNNLAGADFSLLAVGDIVTLIYGDGSKSTYKVTQIRRFQALTPTSPYSRFLDLDDPTSTLDVTTVFKMIYASEGRLVLQTCIAQGNVDSWGRLFVIAEPVKLTPPVVLNFRQALALPL
jgi:hypothetical protein